MAITLDGTNGIVTPDLDSGPVAGTTANFSGNMTLGSSVLETPVGSAPAYVCRAWVNFNGTLSSGNIRASGNVSSVTRNGTGDYTVNFTTALPDANYSTNISWNQPTFGSTVIGAGVHSDISDNLTTYSTTQVRIRSMFINTSNQSTVRDQGLICVSVFR